MRTGKCKKNMEEEKKNKNNMEDKEMSFEERQYERLIKARNFHYENFNKWSLYFYAIIAALFIGYYSIKDNVLLSCVIALVGYIVSMCCYLSGKGYYYWEISWIRLAQAYEKRLNEILSSKDDIKKEFVYSIFVEKDKSSHPSELLSGSNISSSKLSLLISFVISSAWGYLLATLMCHVIWKIIHELINVTFVLKPCCKMLLEIMILLVSIGVTYYIVYITANSDKIKSRMNNLDEANDIAELKEFLKID